MPRFRAQLDADGRGTGGKAPRLRRSAAAYSPYIRPPAVDPPEQRGWLSVLVSGAGKLICAVFGSESDSDESSCSCSEYEYDYIFDDVDYIYATYLDDDLDQPRVHLGLIEEETMDHLPLASIGEPKLVIEELIRQETFTRDECNRLVEMVQSRVVDFPTTQSGNCRSHNELPNRNCCSNIASSKVMQLGPCYEPNLKSPVLDGSLGIPSPMPFVDLEHSAELCDKAVMEANKWVHENGSGSNMKADLSWGPCTLNTEMHNYGSDGDVGSPVALAKLYMNVLPPWKSLRTMTADRSIPSVTAINRKHESLDPVSSSLRSANEDPVIDVLSGLKQTTLKKMSISPLSSRSDPFDRNQDDPGTSRPIQERLRRNHGFGICLPKDLVKDINASCAIEETFGCSVPCKTALMDASYVEQTGLHEDLANTEPISMIFESTSAGPSSNGINGDRGWMASTTVLMGVGELPISEAAAPRCICSLNMRGHGSTVNSNRHLDANSSANTLKSIKKLLRENPQGTNGQGKKPAVRSRRGRGRGRGGSKTT